MQRLSAEKKKISAKAEKDMEEKILRESKPYFKRYLIDDDGKPYTLRNDKTKIYPKLNLKPTRTKQSHKAECDINTIMKQHDKKTSNPRLDVKGIYGDYSNLPDFQAMDSIIKEAQSAFDNLPSQTRNYFGNNPHNLGVFLKDSKNKDKAVELGLIDKPINPPVSTDAGGKPTVSSEGTPPGSDEGSGGTSGKKK